jgi:hypothetical protein
VSRGEIVRNAISDKVLPARWDPLPPAGVETVNFAIHRVHADNLTPVQYLHRKVSKRPLPDPSVHVSA